MGDGRSEMSKDIVQPVVAYLEITDEGKTVGVALANDIAMDNALPKGWRWEPLYRAPISSSADKLEVAPSEEARDAQRYRWLREHQDRRWWVYWSFRRTLNDDQEIATAQLDAAIDAAIAKGG